MLLDGRLSRRSAPCIDINNGKLAEFLQIKKQIKLKSIKRLIATQKTLDIKKINIIYLIMKYKLYEKYYGKKLQQQG